MRAHLPAVAVLTLASMTSTAAWATCIANPAPAVEDLAWCVEVKGDTDVVLLEGDHYVSALTLPGGTTLRADPAALTKPVVRTRSPGLINWVRAFFSNAETDYLTGELPTFKVEDSNTLVRVEGLAFVPLWFERSGVPVTIGRVFQVDDAVLEVSDCELTAIDRDPLDANERPSPIWVRSDLSPANRPDLTGGVLADVRGTSSVQLIDVDVSDLVGPELVGAAVHVSGSEAKVEVFGGDFTDSRIGAGMFAAVGGAQVNVLFEDGVDVSEFSNIGSTFGSAVYAAEGGIAEIYAGVYEDNGHKDPTDSSIRTNAGGHLGADRGGTLKIYAGEYELGNAAFGGVAAVRNAQLYVYGGVFGGTGRDQNRARAGGLFAIFEDPGQVGGAPVARIEGGLFQGGLAMRNPVEEDAYVGDEGVGDTPDDPRYGTAGGAIFAIGGELVLDGAEFEANEVVGGPGGGLFTFGTQVEMVNGRFDANHANDGGGAAVLGGSLTISGTNFAGNGYDFPRPSRGGGLFVVDAPLVLHNGSNFTGNFADSGGGLDVLGDENVRITAVEFIENEAAEGAGMRAVAADVRLTNVTFRRNAAEGAGGGLRLSGVYDDDETREPAVATVIDGIFANNRATWGGGLLADQVQLTVDRGTFEDNDALEVGGGLTASGGSLLITEDTTVEGNQAGQFGGGLYVDGAALTVERSHLLGNEAPFGAAAFVEAAPSVFSTNRICANRSTERGSVILSGSDSEPSIFQHNLIDDPSSEHPVIVAGGAIDMVFNDFKHADSPVLTVLRGEVGFRHNIIAYGDPFSLIAATSAERLDAADNVVWGRFEAPDDVAVVVVPDGEFDWEEDGALALEAGAYVSGDPRWRGWADGAEPASDCSFEDHHPRPDSAAISRYSSGMPFVPDDLHAGLWGGKVAANHPDDAWSRFGDGDRIQALFDCDDEDGEVLDRIEQFEDLDGDGVGGSPHEGYACRLLPGFVETGGDCDDQDPDAQVDCAGDSVTFYGSRCSAVGVESMSGIWLIAFAVLLRRRRCTPS